MSLPGNDSAPAADPVLKPPSNVSHLDMLLHRPASHPNDNLVAAWAAALLTSEPATTRRQAPPPMNRQAALEQ